MRYPAVYVLAIAAAGLTGCGRQGELAPPEDARPVDPAIDRYFEGGLDGPMKAPGDTESEEPLRKRSQHDHENQDSGDPDGEAGGNGEAPAESGAEPENDGAAR